ncbi:dihydrodipicolinate synthase family protein [Corticibacterium sp. UT-5YL-CI-8]|nr:dihydrodipicolinate synthase family protein [Tianweitania sp. UT-5YL-CI-8]
MRSVKLGGVVSALLTPFFDDYSIDYASLRKLVDRSLAVKSVGAIFGAGHAGEVASLTRKERAEVTRVISDQVKRRVPVLTGVYTDSLNEAVDHARDAKAAGADAVTIFPPPIFADGACASHEMPLLWHETIAEKADIPLVLFQFSPGGGLGYTPDTLRRLVALPYVVGIKEGSAGMVPYQLNVEICREATPPVPVLTSNNSSLLSSLAVGGEGILSGSGSVIAAELGEMWEAVEEGDLFAARQAHEKLRPLTKCFYKAPFVRRQRF